MSINEQNLRNKRYNEKKVDQTAIKSRKKCHESIDGNFSLNIEKKTKLRDEVKESFCQSRMAIFSITINRLRLLLPINMQILLLAWNWNKKNRATMLSQFFSLIFACVIRRMPTKRYAVPKCVFRCNMCLCIQWMSLNIFYFIWIFSIPTLKKTSGIGSHVHTVKIDFGFLFLLLLPRSAPLLHLSSPLYMECASHHWIGWNLLYILKPNFP